MARIKFVAAPDKPKPCEGISKEGCGEPEPRSFFSDGRPTGVCQKCMNKFRAALARWRAEQALKKGRTTF